MRLRMLVLMLASAVVLVGCQGAGVAKVPKGTTVVEAEAFALQKDVTVQPGAEASGGKAVLFDKFMSKIETTVSLDAGKYQVVVIALAKDGDQDALDLHVSATDREMGVGTVWERVCFDAEYGKFVEASVVPVITLAKKGDLKVTVEVDDETGTLVDRIEFRKVAE